MAGSAGANNVLSQFSGMLPLVEKASFFNPETGRNIKVTIEKPKPTSRFWPFGSKKKHDGAVVPGSRCISCSNSDGYEGIYDYINARARTAEETEPDHPPRPSPESPSDDSSDEDSFVEKFAENYHALKCASVACT